MTKPQDIDWTARAAALRCDGRWLLDGQRRTAEAHFDKHSPIDGRLLGAVARGAAAEVQAAVLSGRAAFDDGRWAQQPPGQRKRVLLRWAELLLAAREELALLECLDMGKPVRNAWQVDVPRCRPLPAVDRRGHRQGVRVSWPPPDPARWRWCSASRWAWWAPSCPGTTRS
jgi:hypothetical protein